jgi:putative transposase
MHRRSHNHSYGESNHHLQFTPKYRVKVFRERIIRKVCKGFCYVIAKQLGIALVAVEFGPDHMHLFVSDCKNWSDSELANRFKGRLAYEIRRRFPELVGKYLWGDHFWSAGYFHETVGSVTADARRYYIERCQKKHWGQQTMHSFTN